MSDLLQSAIARLDTLRKAYAGQSVVYWRGVDSVAITATPQQQDFEIVSQDGSVTVLSGQSWLVSVDDLDTLGAPQRGDLIKWTRSSTTYTYEVMSPGGAPVYEDADVYGQCYRVFTKLVGAT